MYLLKLIGSGRTALGDQVAPPVAKVVPRSTSVDTRRVQNAHLPKCGGGARMKDESAVGYTRCFALKAKGAC